MFEYMTAQEASERWDISVRRVQRLCKEKRIEGVININRVWLIPKQRRNLQMADIKKTKNKMELIDYEKNFNY